MPFADGLRATVEWYRDHRDWSARAKSGEYRKFYSKQYGSALSRAARDLKAPRGEKTPVRKRKKRK